jgi:hypothetical protein
MIFHKKNLAKSISSICFIVGFIFLCQQTSFSQGVTIGSANSPHPTAILDLQSNQKGFLLPRLTSSERNALQQPALGLQIYNTDLNCVQMYFPSGWRSIGCDCLQAPPAPASVSGASTVCPSASQVLFVVQPVPDAAQYIWQTDPQDTVTSSSSGDSILVSFSSQSGTRTLSVQAVNSCGASSHYSYTVTVQPPSASFSANPTSAGINSPVNFSALTPGLSYSWTFQGGSPSSSTSSSAQVSWNAPGNYLVSLTVTDAGGCTALETQSFQVLSCQPPGSNSLTFNFTGSVQQWTVPAGVCQVTMDAYGAQGASNPNGTAGGFGGRSTGVLQVSPGDVLYIYVGGRGIGRTGGGFNGGGSGGTGWMASNEGGRGGGGSDVRYGGTQLSNRVIVAGGGGGAGGRGGAAGGNMSSGAGGGGGGYFGGGGGGAYWGDYFVSAGFGQPGTQSAGGSGGVGSGGAAANGTAGVSGQGGQGGSSGENGSGSGGGTDYSGGNGGGNSGTIGNIASNSNLDWRTGGPGGGGSGFVGGVSNGTMQTGVRSGEGMVVLSW